MFDIMLVVVPLLSLAVFAVVIISFISPKFRGKMMSNQIKAQKYMMDESKEDIKSISDNMAYATKDGIKTAVGAIKEGLKEETIYCKHCGSEIDADSTFCKKCGKEQ